MRRAMMCACGVCAFAACAGSLAASDARPADYQPGMLIKGDQEAPMVLYIVPWQEPRVPEVPEADLQPVLPKVLDDDFGILGRSRPEGRGAVKGDGGQQR